MNNSQINGIIITGPQGFGKTTFLQTFCKNLNSYPINCSRIESPKQRELFHAFLEGLYDMDVIVLQKLIGTSDLPRDLPITSTMRKPFQNYSSTFFRPLILVETQIPKKEMATSLFKRWIVFEYDGSAESWGNLEDVIFKFILSKTM